MRKIKTYYLIYFLFLSVYTFGQNNNLKQNNKNRIFVVAKATKNNSIKLRWAPSNSQVWRKGNQYGYVVKRYTISRNSKILEKQDVKEIGIFKPKPLEQWRDYVSKNDNAAILAQAIYGESFLVKSQDKLEMIVSLSEEQQQRFVWGLFAADQNFEAAKMAGLGFEDKDVKENEKYVYEVVPLTPKDILIIEKGKTLASLSYKQDLPAPKNLFGYFTNKKVLLSWNYKIYKKLYVSYFVERSTDNKNFIRLNKKPLINLNKDKKSGRIFYIDSIPNNKKFYYRVIGKTIFDETSPPSKIIEGMAKPILEYTPQIYSQILIENKTAYLKWRFPEASNNKIIGFELNRSDKADGKYTIVLKNIPPEKREIKYSNLKASNYFTITAIGKNGDKTTSLPAFIQPIDSIPPSKPTGLTGKVDSLGIVTLKWKANQEKDMLGYRIFRGNNRDEEFSQLTVSPHKATVYYDSIGVYNLNSKVFYRIVAVDQRYNQSELSDILALQKPDFIPPAQPVFKTYKITKKGVELTWANSSSSDVVKHELYRKENNNSWQLIYTLEQKNKTPAIVNWIDKKVKPGITYSYTIKAIDQSGLISKAAPVLKIKTHVKNNSQKAIKGLRAEVNRKEHYIELFWKTFKDPDALELIIYKAKNNDKPTVLRHIPVNTNYIKDRNVKPNNHYTYIVRPLYRNGSYGPASKITLKY